MPDPAPPAINRPEIDHTVPQDGNNHGTEGHYSGQEPGSFGNPTPATVDAGAVRGGMPADRADGPGAGQVAEDLPQEAGHRATVDPATGAVHGSGAGAGGTGTVVEEPDDDSGASGAVP